MEAAAMHYRMTNHKAWFLAAAPRLKKASERVLRQRKAWAPATPRSAWGYGLQPPINFGDYGGANLFYLVNARFYNGMFSTTRIMTELGVEGADKLMQEIGEYRQDIRAAADRSAALTPAVRSSDGTYRRFVPATPYNRSNICNTFDGIMGFACLADSDSGVYGSGDPLVKDVIDVIEGSLKNGITYQMLLGMDPKNAGWQEQWFKAPQGGAKAARVPGVIQDVYADYHGLAWYWRDFTPPANPHAGGRYWLRFGAVDYLADVYVNGIPVGSHEGSQEPFVLDATAAVRSTTTPFSSARGLAA